jgi:hypothetical protein
MIRSWWRLPRPPRFGWPGRVRQLRLDRRAESARALRRLTVQVLADEVISSSQIAWPMKAR